MPAQTMLSSALAHIFVKMNTIFNIPLGKRQRDLLQELFRTVFARQGRLTFTNLARYSHLHEQTFRRHFARAFDWVAFNLVILRLHAHPEEVLIGVFDTSFLPKSGKKTYGLDKFFSSVAQAMRTGLEISLLGVVATGSRRAIALDATQTPPGLSTKETGAAYSRIDFYLEQITDCLDRLPKVRYWVGDGYYAKMKVFNTLTRRGKDLITKLRSDANLRFVIAPERRRGRYGGKVRFTDFGAIDSRFEALGGLDDLPHIRLYTARVNSEYFKRDFRLVVLHNTRTDEYAVLCSTDVEQPAQEVVSFYRLRYQIEFIIRDAKQFTGLTHCQARSQAKLDFHLNLSVSAVNVARLVSQRLSISLGSYTRELYNTFLVGRLLSQLSLEAEFGLSHPRIRHVIETGRIAA